MSLECEVQVRLLVDGDKEPADHCAPGGPREYIQNIL